MSDSQSIKAQGDVIWNIANKLRGPYRPPQYRRVMIPLTVLRRLDCVLESTKQQVLDHHRKLLSETKVVDGETVAKYDSAMIEKLINGKFKLPFHNTSEFTFQKLLGDADNIAPNLLRYIAGFSSNARKILEKFKFDEEIEKLDEANRLFEVIQEVAKVDLHPQRVPNIEMGYLFEDLVRRFNEQANEEAGDHFTPREVIKLMVNLLFTFDDMVYKEGKVIKIYDPTCGTGGMLSEAEKVIIDPDTGLNPSAHVELFGQEYNPESYAICGSDLMIKGEDVKNIIFGDTLGTGKAKEGFVDGDGHPDETFHYILANPPFGVEWKSQKDHVTKEHKDFGFGGRFGPGLPRINDGALLFLLHMISKMGPATGEGDGARIGVIFNGSPLFTGDAGQGESNIRRWIIENDMLEAVVGLPDQLFYNTGIYTYLWIVTNRKPAKRRGKVQLINGTEFALKMKPKSLGDKRKMIGDGNDGTPDHIKTLTELYGAFEDGTAMRLGEIQTNIDPSRDQAKSISVSKIFENREFGYVKITVERPLRLNFTINDERLECFKETGYFKSLAESKKRKDKAAAAKEEAEGRATQTEILKVLESLRPGFADGSVVKDRAVFEKQLKTTFKKSPVSLDGTLKKALLAPGSLGERDKTAEICRDSKGQPEPDAELRDTENVPLPPEINLPLPLDYSNKPDLDRLLALVQDHCQAYFDAEVKPYRPDAWIDWKKTKVGYEIPFTRHFYQYEPPRPLEVIEGEIKALESEILQMLQEVTV
jgi:type I restriction enzyme M protein